MSRSHSIALLLVLSIGLVVVSAYQCGLAIPGLSSSGHAISQDGEAPIVVSSSWYESASDYLQAKEEQERLKVPLFVYFRTSWCPYCKKFEKDLLSSDEVTQFMKSVVKVRIDPEAGPEERSLANQYGVTGYPSIFIVPAGIDVHAKIYPFRDVGDTFAAVTPYEFVRECQLDSGVSRR